MQCKRGTKRSRKKRYNQRKELDDNAAMYLQINKVNKKHYQKTKHQSKDKQLSKVDLIISMPVNNGTISKWLVSEGDIISIGNVIAEIETNEAIMEIEATNAGIIKRLLFKKGAQIIENAPIAIMECYSEPNENIKIKKKTEIKNEYNEKNRLANDELSTAIEQGEAKIEMLYKDKKGKITRRKVDIYECTNTHLIGFCNLVYERRTFLRSGILELKRLE
tara:strand:- start:267 stop:926 length:660 start_codon:yes stop_codon:yes gene_type:complete